MAEVAEPSPLSTMGPYKKGAVLSDLRDKRDQIKKDLNAFEARRDKGDYVCNFFAIVSPSFGVSVGLEAELQVDLEAVCKVVATLSPTMVKAKKDSLVDAERAIDDPPSQDCRKPKRPVRGEAFSSCSETAGPLYSRSGVRSSAGGLAPPRPSSARCSSRLPPVSSGSHPCGWTSRSNVDWSR
jgi:hypothetical protein